jgi:hypothetical protein
MIPSLHRELLAQPLGFIKASSGIIPFNIFFPVGQMEWLDWPGQEAHQNLAIEGDEFLP